MDVSLASQNPARAREGICTVATLVQQVRQALDRAIPLQWVCGEITGFKRAASGHCYFELKDADAQVACVLYRNRAALVGFELRDGAQVELRLRPSIYEPRGSLQFAVEQARLAGVGRLYEAFLRLKAQLESEGLFELSRKRELPRLPRSVGLITSPKAAALADMLRVLRDRWPQARVVLYPASVQGAAAPAELRAALAAANARADCEVLIIGRGGGSIEDLWAFNDEALVRAVATSSIPIVSAVGHETDVTLCDFAADMRAPTPTAAAALVVPERAAMLAQTAQLGSRLQRAMTRRVEYLSQRLDRVGDQLRTRDRSIARQREYLSHLSMRLDSARNARLNKPRTHVAMLHARYAQSLTQRMAFTPSASRVTAIDSRLQSSMQALLDVRSSALARLSQALTLLNPDGVLERGYAMLLDADHRVVTQADDVEVGDALTVRLRRGSLKVGVERRDP